MAVISNLDVDFSSKKIHQWSELCFQLSKGTLFIMFFSSCHSILVLPMLLYGSSRLFQLSIYKLNDSPWRSFHKWDPEHHYCSYSHLTLWFWWYVTWFCNNSGSPHIFISLQISMQCKNWENDPPPSCPWPIKPSEPLFSPWIYSLSI